ncbi:IS3 family transposase [Staphylococcus shinii]|uniref:IS3 family transposase n=1 Tax=Staphylococcus shinii TaxID=2912228 RepID=UPI00384B6538
MYGYRRVTQSLSSKGFKVNHKKVRKLMKELKLTCQNLHIEDASISLTKEM